jgi:hypothetical protein
MSKIQQEARPIRESAMPNAPIRSAFDSVLAILTSKSEWRRRPDGGAISDEHDCIPAHSLPLLHHHHPHLPPLPSESLSVMIDPPHRAQVSTTATS